MMGNYFDALWIAAGVGFIGEGIFGTGGKGIISAWLKKKKKTGETEPQTQQ